MLDNLINVKNVTSSNMNLIFFLVFIILCLYLISKICSSKGNIFLFLGAAIIVCIILKRMNINIDTNSNVGIVLSDFKTFISSVIEIIKSTIGPYLH